MGLLAVPLALLWQEAPNLANSPDPVMALLVRGLVFNFWLFVAFLVVWLFAWFWFGGAMKKQEVTKEEVEEIAALGVVILVVRLVSLFVAWIATLTWDLWWFVIPCIFFVVYVVLEGYGVLLLYYLHESERRLTGASIQARIDQVVIGGLFVF